VYASPICTLSCRQESLEPQYVSEGDDDDSAAEAHNGLFACLQRSGDAAEAADWADDVEPGSGGGASGGGGGVGAASGNGVERALRARLYRVSGGRLEPMGFDSSDPQASTAGRGRRLDVAILDAGSVIVVDCAAEVYVWHGRGHDKGDAGAARGLAAALAAGPGRPPWLSVLKVSLNTRAQGRDLCR